MSGFEIFLRMKQQRNVDSILANAFWPSCTRLTERLACRPDQGCQIFLGTPYQNGENRYQITINYTKWPQNIPNGCKIDPMAIKYTNIFYCKTLQNLPKLGFLFSKYTIWQPWSRPMGMKIARARLENFRILFQAWVIRCQCMLYIRSSTTGVTCSIFGDSWHPVAISPTNFATFDDFIN
jgi:hypothetical protein